MEAANHRQHLKGLDGLRGVAIVMVFLFHYYPRKTADPLGFLTGTGWAGVDLFFVLSGFLITGILYDTLNQRHYFSNFYARRALRLFPIYFLMVAILLIVGPWVGERYSWWDIPFFLYGSNVVKDMGARPDMGPHIETIHLWSLALEEQFYLLWAPAVFLLKTRKNILIACLCGGLFSILLRWTLVAHPFLHGYTAYMELPTRLDGLLCGSAIAIALRMRPNARWINPALLNIAVCLGAAVFALCIYKARSSHWGSAPMEFFGYIGASLMFGASILLAILPGTWLNHVGSNSFLRMCGRYSYSFYLWHYLPFTLYQHFLDFVNKIIRVTILGHVVGIVLLFFFNLGIASLSYHGVEVFFLRMKRHFAYDDEQSSTPPHMAEEAVEEVAAPQS